MRRLHGTRRGARAVGLALALGLAGVRVDASAARYAIEGVAFAPRAEAGEQVLTLRGLGLLRYRAFIKAYVAALYLAPGVPPARVLDDVPKRLEIEYFWSLDGRDIAEAGEALVRERVDAATWRSLTGRLERIAALYADVEPGDRYALTYVPGGGTELSLNDRPLGTIPGADFAAAYFGIWLGDDPLDEALRQQLLVPR